MLMTSPLHELAHLHNHMFGRLPFDGIHQYGSQVHHQSCVHADIIAMACGNFYVVAVKSNGDVWGSGYKDQNNYYGQLAGLSNSRTFQKIDGISGLIMPFTHLNNTYPHRDHS